MKVLWLMRHAKSDWSEPGRADFDRPLNKRGTRDAPVMGQWIATRENRPQLIVSSPARRAWMTAGAVADACGFDRDDIQRWDLLYPGNVALTTGFLTHLPPEIQRVMLVGHNPHMEELATLLATDASQVHRFPTAAVALMVLEAERWTELAPGKLLVHQFMTPKLLPSSGR